MKHLLNARMWRIFRSLQHLDSTHPGEAFPEQPDGLGIRRRVAGPKPKKAYERQPVADLEFGLITRHPIERLKNRNLEH